MALYHGMEQLLCMMYKYDVQDTCVIHVVNDIYEHICYTGGQGTCKLATFHSIFSLN
jgi:hypothetical protein